MRSKNWGFLSFAALTIVAAPATADVIDPTEEACFNAVQGDVCAFPDDSAGTCEPSECCRLDYENLDENGVPGTICEPCLVCSTPGADGGVEGAEGLPPVEGSEGLPPEEGAEGLSPEEGAEGLPPEGFEGTEGTEGAEGLAQEGSEGEGPDTPVSSDDGASGGTGGGEAPDGAESSGQCDDDDEDGDDEDGEDCDGDDDDDDDDGDEGTAADAADDDGCSASTRSRPAGAGVPLLSLLLGLALITRRRREGR